MSWLSSVLSGSGLGNVVSGVTSILGFNAANDQAKAQREANKNAKNATERGLAIQEREAAERAADRAKLRSQIEGYDYGADTQRAVDAAKGQVGSVLEQRLRALNADFRKGGGVPGNSSEFRVRSQGVANQTLSPYAAFIADRVAAEHEAKMRDQAILLGQPVGQLSDGYFRAANAFAMTGGPAPNFSSPLELLMRALVKKPGTKTDAPVGAGGSGDSRYGGTYGGLSNFLSQGGNLGLYGGAVNA